MDCACRNSANVSAGTLIFFNEWPCGGDDESAARWRVPCRGYRDPQGLLQERNDSQELHAGACAGWLLHHYVLCNDANIEEAVPWRTHGLTEAR